MTQTQPRTRTFTWSDPNAHAEVAATATGLELLQAMSRGELPAPPIMHLIGSSGRLKATDQGSLVGEWGEGFTRCYRTM